MTAAACAGSPTASRRWAGGSSSTAPWVRGRRCARKFPVRRRSLRAARLLRAVTSALSSPDAETAYARLPGALERGAEGTLEWSGGTLSIPVPGVGALRLQTHEPDDDLLAAAESVSFQVAQ